MKTAIALVLMLWVSTVAAQSDTVMIVIHSRSYHIDRKDQLNEANFGLGVRYGVLQDGGEDSVFLSAGAYKNSQYRLSTYVSVGSVLWSVKFLKVSASVGAVSGYKDLSMAPYVLPEVSIHRGPVAVIVNYLPFVKMMGVESPATIAVSVGITF